MIERCRLPHPRISGISCDLREGHDGPHRGHTCFGTYPWHDAAENAALDLIRSYLEDALPFLGITAPEQVREAISTLEASIIRPGSADA